MSTPRLPAALASAVEHARQALRIPAHCVVTTFDADPSDKPAHAGTVARILNRCTGTLDEMPGGSRHKLPTYLPVVGADGDERYSDYATAPELAAAIAFAVVEAALYERACIDASARALALLTRVDNSLAVAA